MLQTHEKVFQIVPKCPIQTHRCPNGLVPANVVYSETQKLRSVQISFFPPIQHHNISYATLLSLTVLARRAIANCFVDK